MKALVRDGGFEWSDANVVLLPKGNKWAASPLQWRPIGLQDPLGKSIMGILVRRAKPYIEEWVGNFPQAAYTNGRTTGIALKPVFSHCHKVRHICSLNCPNPHKLWAGYQKLQFCGEVQLCLDFSAAFDGVQWGHIKPALEMARVPAEIQEVMQQVRYHFDHAGLKRTLHPTHGLRQGCKAFPVLWSAYTALACAANDSVLQDWTKEHAALYADEHHLRWEFYSYSEFERLLERPPRCPEHPQAVQHAGEPRQDAGHPQMLGIFACNCQTGTYSGK